MAPVHWLVLIVILAVIEIATQGLTTIWFAGGALVGFFLCILGFGWQVQAVGFLVVSFLLLIFTRPWAIRHFNSKTVKTNAESIVGQTAIVTENIDNLHGTGSVSISGQIWTARSTEEGHIIPADTEVIVEKIAGVKAIVRAKEDQ